MSDSAHLKALLVAGLKEYQFKISVETETQLLQYIELLHQWNGVHNLTAIRDKEEMIQKHLLDSLVLVPYLKTGKIVDIGTGAGVPGIPLALLLPDSEFVLLDSNQKKITFVQHVILFLKLTNVRAICTRVEAYQPPELFDWVISRAFASLSEFVRLSQHLCKNEGSMIAMKGAIDPAEIAAVSSPMTVKEVLPVKVPGLEASRSLVFMTVNREGNNGER